MVAPVVIPSENLVTEGLPPIPVKLAADARRYTESRAVRSAAWHPVRRELLISTRFGNTNQLHMVRIPGGDRKQLTFFDEPVNGGSFDPSGRYVVFGRDTGGDEFTQLYRLDLADGKVTLLTDGGRSQNGGVQWNRAGTLVAYGSTRRNGVDRDIYLMNPADPATNRMVLQGSGGGWGVTDWSPDGRQLVVLEYLSKTQSRAWLVDAANGQKTLLTLQGADTVLYGGAKFSLDGRGFYLTSDRSSEYRQLYYYGLGANAFTPLTTDIPWDVDGFELSPDGKRVAFKTNEGGTSRVYVLETATRQYHALTIVPTGVVGSLTWHSNNRDLAFTVSSPYAPSDVYSVDVESGQLTQWTESELGGVQASELTEPTLITFKSFDGVTITAFYHKPPARFTGPRPVILNIHGGAGGQSRPAFLGRANYFLNELGVAIISPNVRGSGGYGKSFLKLDNGAKRADAVKDIGSLLDWIARQPELDASKILVTGGSGGYLTLAVATEYQDRIAAAMTLGVAAEINDRSGSAASADVVSISSFLTMLQSSDRYRPSLNRLGGGGRDSTLRAFLERSALLSTASGSRSTVGNLNTASLNTGGPGNVATTGGARPLFLVQGGNDPRISVSDSDQLVTLAKQNGGPVWYLLGKDEGNGFRKKSNIDFQFYAAVLFVRQYLLGEAVL